MIIIDKCLQFSVHTVECADESIAKNLFNNALIGAAT